MLTRIQYDVMTPEERKWLRRHTGCFLLHDFDFYQKWRCAYAWADKERSASPEEIKKMDWMGTGQLRCQVAVHELFESQKEHFEQVP